MDNPLTNGHTTTCDLLWSGLPVITLPLTKNMPSRVASSIVNAIGIPEMIMENYYQYEETAVVLATSPESNAEK